MKILTDDGDDDIWVLAGDVGEERKDIVQDKHLVKALQEVVHARQRVDPHLTHNHTRCTALRDTALCDGTHTIARVVQRCVTHCTMCDAGPHHGGTCTLLRDAEPHQDRTRVVQRCVTHYSMCDTQPHQSGTHVLRRCVTHYTHLDTQPHHGGTYEEQHRTTP